MTPESVSGYADYVALPKGSARLMNLATAIDFSGSGMRLSDLRRAHGRTQEQVAEALGTTQSGVSRIERQEDILVSTLRAYVAAVGGALRLVVAVDDDEIELLIDGDRDA